MSKKITEKRKINFIANSYLVIGVFLVALGTIIIILARYPQVWYAMEINTVENEFATLTSPIEEDIREYRELLRDRGDELEEIDLEEEEEEIRSASVRRRIWVPLHAVRTALNGTAGQPGGLIAEVGEAERERANELENHISTWIAWLERPGSDRELLTALGRALTVASRPQPAPRAG